MGARNDVVNTRHPLRSPHVLVRDDGFKETVVEPDAAKSVRTAPWLVRTLYAAVILLLGALVVEHELALRREADLRNSRDNFRAAYRAQRGLRGELWKAHRRIERLQLDLQSAELDRVVAAPFADSWPR